MNTGPNDVLHFVLTIVNYGQPKPLHNISVSYSLPDSPVQTDNPEAQATSAFRSDQQQPDGTVAQATEVRPTPIVCGAPYL